jgi:hypothetical protein
MGADNTFGETNFNPTKELKVVAIYYCRRGTRHFFRLIGEDTLMMIDKPFPPMKRGEAVELSIC